MVLRDTYEIVRLIGAGGMSDVYEARHTRFPGRFAVKVLRGRLVDARASLRRLRREAEITSSLRHPHIVQVVDFDETEDGPYLVMEFLEGQDLGAALAASGPLPLGRVADLVDQIAAALDAAHSQGIVHRDLKPQNVFLVRVSGGGRDFAKVLDFGISKLRMAAIETDDSRLLGTPQYMAPEQIVGAADVDGRTDQFALGAMIYEMLSGVRPFDGANVPATLYRIAHEPPRKLTELVPSLPEGAAAAVERAMAKDKQARFTTVREFAAAFLGASGRRLSAAMPISPAAATVKGDTPTMASPSGRGEATTTSPAGHAEATTTSPAGHAEATTTAPPSPIPRRPSGRRTWVPLVALPAAIAAMGVVWLARRPAERPPEGPAPAPATVAKATSKGTVKDSPADAVLISTRAEAGPPIATGTDTGEVLAAWRESHGKQFKIWANVLQPGSGWQRPRPVQKDGDGAGRSVMVALNRRSQGLLVWRASDGGPYRPWGAMYDGRAGAGEPRALAPNILGETRAIYTGIDERGRGLAVWYQEEPNGGRIWAALHDRGRTWRAAEPISDATNGGSNDFALSVATGGAALVLWADGRQNRPGIWARRLTFGEKWTPAERVDGGTAGRVTTPLVRWDERGAATAVWHETDVVNARLWTNRYTRQGWSGALRLDDATHGRPSTPALAVSPAGRAAVVWRGHGGLWLSEFTPETGWSPGKRVGAAGLANSPGILVGDDGAGILSWLTSAHGDNDLMYMRFGAGGERGEALRAERLPGGVSFTWLVGTPKRASLVWLQRGANDVPAVWSLQIP